MLKSTRYDGQTGRKSQHLDATHKLLVLSPRRLRHNGLGAGRHARTHGPMSENDGETHSTCTCTYVDETPLLHSQLLPGARRFVLMGVHVPITHPPLLAVGNYNFIQAGT